MISTEQIANGLYNNEFTFYYQAKVSLVTGKVTGAEALLRWIKPDGTVINPDDFIPLAEQSDLIKEITYRMFSKLSRDILILNDLNKDLIVSFNASGKDFEDTRFTQLVLETIRQLHISPKNLQIEITETAVLNAHEHIRENIQILTNAGISLIMDDYGSGYANLETLRKWPFSGIKLDRSIIQPMLESAKNQTIAEASIRMAHELDLNVIAEGVESEQQYQMLLEFGCTKVQGYWVNRPQPLDDFLYFVEQDLRWSGLPVGLIHMAVIDHIQWRKKLTSDLVRIATVPLDSPERKSVYHLPMDHHDCRLGKWYYGIGQQFKDCPIFKSIEQPHAEFHRLGQQLIATVNQGGTMRDLTPLLSEFSEQSAVILDYLHQLAHKGLMEMHQAHQSWRDHHLYPENL